MKNYQRIIGVMVLVLLLLTLPGSIAFAGRTGGPASEIGTVGMHETVTYSIAFNANEPAVVMVSGDGRSNLELVIFDADQHVINGVGLKDQLTATMNVYRAGTFRVEVRNLGPLPNTFKITTN